MKKNPPRSNYWREIPGTISTVLISSVLEIIALRMWATGYLTNTYMDHWAHPFRSFFWFAGMSFHGDGYVGVAHRAMHPWNTGESPYYIIRCIPDFGYYLFKYVHSYHHLSENTTILSGHSMHPVDGVFYTS